MRFSLSLLFFIAFLYSACNQAGRSASPPVALTSATGNQNIQAQQPCVNLNTAGIEELKTLPGVGEARARRIIEYRERHGNFRRPQEIIVLDDFSEKLYRAIAPRLCAE